MCVCCYCLNRNDNKYSEPERSCGVINLLGVSQNRGVTSGAVTSWPKKISLQPIQLPAACVSSTLELCLKTQVLLVLYCGGVEAENLNWTLTIHPFLAIKFTCHSGCFERESSGQ